MGQYVVKRLIAMIPVLIGVSAAIFVIVRMLPGDMAVILAGEGATPEQIETIRDQLGLNEPLPAQYMDWLAGILQGDFGTSRRTGIEIGPEIVRRLPITLELTILAMLFSLVIAIPAGVVSALRQDSALDYGARLFSIGGLSVPEFWTGLLFLVLPVIWFGWAPNMAYVALWENPRANLEQFLFPAVAMGISLSAIITRMVRSSLLEVLRADYIRTARAKGLVESRVVLKHALRNAFIPVVTILGLQLGRLLGGAVVLERIYSLPGLGRFVFEAISERDYLMLQTVVLVIALSYALVNLAVDLAYAWLDPRIRYA